jgi:hypothetical protein
MFDQVSSGSPLEEELGVYCRKGREITPSHLRLRADDPYFQQIIDLSSKGLVFVVEVGSCIGRTPESTSHAERHREFPEHFLTPIWKDAFLI